jgi:predicted deacylase
MSVKERRFSVGVSHRVDGEPWQLRFLELRGSRPGPSTAFVAGVFGDKPLGTHALWLLAERLRSAGDLGGTVLLCPAANPFALEAGTRISPDHLYLNRVFPGMGSGFLTNQIADALFQVLVNATDCVIDVHSGTPDMALWYTYDYGDPELSAAFGYLPVVLGMAQPGQLSKAFVDAGGKSALVEFGGASLGDPTVGVEGCLNVLRYRGHLPGSASGPAKVSLIDGDVAMFLPSHSGMLVSDYAAGRVGERAAAGRVAALYSPGTGELLEEFVAEREGAQLMLLRSSPAMVAPGDFGAVIAYPAGEIDIPNH